MTKPETSKQTKSETVSKRVALWALQSIKQLSRATNQTEFLDLGPKLGLNLESLAWFPPWSSLVLAHRSGQRFVRQAESSLCKTQPKHQLDDG